MTDPAGITQRGAEQSAPRSRWGLSAAESHGVSRLGTYVMSSHVAEQPVFALYGQPPRARRQLECRATVAKLGPHNGFAAGARRAVEAGAKRPSWLGVPPREIGSIRAQLRAQRCRAAPSTVACLTSTGRCSDPRHMGIVSLGVFDGATITASEASRLAVEGIACAPKCGVQ